MPEDELTQEQRDWRDRCKAVSLAQGRYLNVLMLSAVFFLALADKLKWTVTGGDLQDLSFLGLQLHAGTILVAGVVVLSLVLHATLGTFPAYWRAHFHAAKGLPPDAAFERLEVAPSSIDFIIYVDTGYVDAAESTPRNQPKLLIYPIAIWLVVVEIAVFVIGWSMAWPSLLTTQKVLLVLGVGLFLVVLPRVMSVTKLKLRHAFPRAELVMSKSTLVSSDAGPRGAPNSVSAPQARHRRQITTP